MHASLRFSVPAALALLVAAAPRAASASPSFPDDIKADLSLGYSLGTTHCTICHRTNLGGVGTVIQPFGVAMKAAGLMQLDDPTVQAALDTLDANKTDSDCDGVPDVEQLEQGRDPNTGEYIDGSGRPTPVPDGGVEGCPMGNAAPTTAYGCGAQLAPAAAGSAGAWSAGILAAIMLAASLRRRRSRAPARE